MRAEGESFHGVFPPNPEGEILDVLAPCPIISVLTVHTIRILRPNRRATLIFSEGKNSAELLVQWLEKILFSRQSEKL